MALFDFVGSLSASKDSITFLVTVNDTWKWDPPIYNDTCMVTVKTNPLLPNRPLNKTEKVNSELGGGGGGGGLCSILAGSISLLGRELSSNLKWVEGLESRLVIFALEANVHGYKD